MFQTAAKTTLKSKMGIAAGCRDECALYKNPAVWLFAGNYPDIAIKNKSKKK